MPEHRAPRSRQRRLRARLLGAIILATVCGMASAAHAGSLPLTLSGTIQTTGEPRPASLRILCDPAPNGALSLELSVPKAFTLKDFDYADFEGPDAVARDSAFTYVTTGGDAGLHEITYPTSGWYSGEDPDTFVFGLSDRPAVHEKVAMIVRAISPDHTELVWVQRSFDEPPRALRGTFPLDAATIARIKATTDPCLAARAKSPSKKKH